MKFLHCMRQPAYLEQALTEGVMLTSHKVEFRLTHEINELAEWAENIQALLHEKLAWLGRPWASLTEERRNVLWMGLGTVRGSVPMFCLTEIPEGRSVEQHQKTFGSYGFIPTKDWVIRNGGDRVIYIGENSPVSQHLASLVATMNIFSLILTPQGEPVFENRAVAAALKLLCHVETRTHFEEAEWRIVGNPGWMGGHNDAGKRIPLLLDDIELVLVENEADVREFGILIEELGRRQNAKNRPRTIVFPTHVA